MPARTGPLLPTKMNIAAFAAVRAIGLAGRFGANTLRGVIVNEHLLSARQTRLHVETLGRLFDFIHHDDLVDRVSRARSRPFCLLTFDDGKRSMAGETAPELERLGVPAVFYLPTRFVADRTPLWFDRQAAIVKALGHVPPELDVDILKQLPLELVDERLDRVCRKHTLLPAVTGDDVLPMSWDEARDLARRGFTIGAHGARHAILTREPEARALAEIRESIATVRAEIGAACVSFAFPNGNYTARLAGCAIECGVRTVMTTEPTWVRRHVPSWRLPRVQLRGSDSATKIATKLALAATGWALDNPDGTGRLYWRIDCMVRRGAVNAPVPGIDSKRDTAPTL